MAITAIVGKIGSGKSFKQLQYALEQCQEKRKRLVTNFGLNLVELRRYASMRKMGWIAHLIDTRQIAVIDAVEHIEDLLQYSNSVVCLDEAGIFLNSREFSKTPKKLLMDLAQSRKDGVDLIYASQFDEQVDKQMRFLTQWFIHAQGISVYDKRLKRPRLSFKHYFYFDAENYFDWASSPRKKGSFFRSWLAAFKMEFGAVTSADLQLFKCFDSFARLEKQKQHQTSINQDLIPEDLPQVLRHGLKASYQARSRYYLGGALELPAARPPARCVLPYQYSRSHGLLVRYVSPSARAAGWCMAEPLIR